MKYIVNPVTGDYESTSFTFRDRFALGGRVNFDKGSPFPITDKVLEQIDDLIKNTNFNLKEIGNKIKYGTETHSMTIDTPVMKKYIEKYGKPSDARLQTRGVSLSSDKGLGKKIVKAYDKQIKNFGKPDISKIAREVYGPGVKDFDSARAQVRSVLGRFRDYKGKANIPIDKKDLTPEQIKSKARVKKLKPVDNPTITKFMAGPKNSGFQYHHMDATKTSMVTLNNVVYLPSEVNNYIQSYEGPISQRKKEITKLNKNKPKGYKKLIDTKLNQIRNTIAKADMDLDKLGYSAYKGVIEVDTVDVNGKPIKIGGGSALRLGEGFAQELGLDPNKPLKEFSSKEQIKLTEAKKALIKKSSINKPKATGLAKKLTEAKKALIKKSSINKPKATGLAKKGLKTALKQLPIVGSAIGLYDMGKAVQAGVRNPIDLYAAYEVSPEVALKNKAMREDKTGKLLAEEISNLPDISAEASLMDDLTPYGKFLQEGGQLSFEEFQKMQSIPQSDRPITGSIDIPEMDGTMMAAEGGRVNFGEGSPDPDFLNAISAARDNDNIPIGDKTFLGMKLADNPLQRFNEMIDPRAYPYYGQKIVEGASRIPEYAVRTVPALASLGSETVANLVADRYPEGKVERFIDRISPKITNKAQEAIGLTKLIEDTEKNRTGAQKQYGEGLEFLAEVPGPATPIGFLLKAPKYIRQLRGLTGSATAAKELENKIQEKVAVDQGRRDFNILLGTGGVMAVVKALGLDKLIPVGSKVAQKTTPIVTPGGTPKYFFDFVNLIKKSGDDISETAATVERQKVYDYKGYTMYEDLSSGEIRINKQNEGVGSGYNKDGEREIFDTITGQEEIMYKPGEEIVGKDGKAVKTLDEYEEATAKPDSYGDMEGEAGLDSIDEILELLLKDGKKYSKTELKGMGIDIDALGNYPSGAGSVRLEDLVKSKKAGGGIMKLAGDDSGPPPTSGPNSEGLALILKRGRKY